MQRAKLLLKLRRKRGDQRLDALPRQERDTFLVDPELPSLESRVIHPEVDLQEVLLAFARLMKRSDRLVHHQVSREPLSTRERMSQVLDYLSKADNYLAFDALFDLTEGRQGQVVTFMALLELVKEQLVELVQTQLFAMIHVRLKTETSL